MARVSKYLHEQGKQLRTIRQQQQQQPVGIRYASKLAVSKVTRKVLAEHGLAFELLKKS